MENGSTHPDPAPARARHHIGASPLTSFVGREREAATLSGLLRRAEIRLITLTGPGGIGKTRLALRVAEDVAEDFPDGIWFVSLAGTRDPSLVLPAIAETLNIREAGLPLAEGLALHLRNKRCLLILDNFEHVIEAAPLVASVLQSCPLLSCLVTSRAVLRLSGEHAFPLPPLPLPPKALTTTRERARLSPAVQLFVARAQAAQPEFTLSDANAIDIEMICRQLEGLPLGIELAAARVRHLSLSELAEQLGSDRHTSLRVLTGGPRDAPDRHRALRHAIAWSYDLLDADASTLFRRLGVFTDGFTASAAEAIALAIPGITIDVSEGISSLVDQSLLQRENNPIGTSRYRMLETIREFALEKLAMSGELPGIEAAHTAFFLSLVELAAPALHSEQQAIWLRRLASDHGNVRSALWRCEQQGDAVLGLRFAAALWRFWQRQGYWEEGRRWLTRLLSLVGPDTQVDHVAHASALTGAGWLAHYQNDFAAATTLLDEGLALYRQLGRDDNLAEVLLCRGLAARSIGETRRANDSFEEAVSLSRKLGDLPRIAESLFHLSFIARELGNYERAGALCEEGLALHQKAGHLDGKALALLGLGDIARDLAQPAAVRRWCGESLAMFRDLGEPLGEGFSLHNLALAAYQDGDLVEARALCEASLSNFRRLGVEAAMAEVLASLGSILDAAGDTEAALASLTEALHLSTRVGPRWLVASSLEGIAVIAVRNRQDRVAVELASRAEALRAELHVPVRPNWQGELEDALSSARSALGAKAFAAAWEAGHGRSIDQAIADATAVKPCPIPSRLQGDRLKQSRPAYNLSTRELEVLRLLVAGRSDREIADALFISRRTASKHVGAILSKLGVDSRTEATARAIRESLI